MPFFIDALDLLLATYLSRRFVFWLAIAVIIVCGLAAFANMLEPSTP
jgi:hypothetical protein